MTALLLYCPSLALFTIQNAASKIHVELESQSYWCASAFINKLFTRYKWEWSNMCMPLDNLQGTFLRYYSLRTFHVLGNLLRPLSVLTHSIFMTTLKHGATITLIIKWQKWLLSLVPKLVKRGIECKLICPGCRASNLNCTPHALLWASVLFSTSVISLDPHKEAHAMPDQVLLTSGNEVQWS